MHIFLRLYTILQANSIKKRKLSEAIIISANDLPTHYMRQCLVCLLLIGPLKTDRSEILIEI